MAATPDLISIRAFGKLVGVSHTAIEKAIARGRLTAIDPETKQLRRNEALREWAALRQQNTDGAVDVGEHSDRTNWGVAYTKASTLVKVEQAKKLALERQECEGKLHRAEDVLAVWTEILSNVRAELLSMPRNVAGAISARLKRDRIAIEEIVQCEVEKALTKLSVDTPNAIREQRSRRLRK